ncbi:MAG: thiamine kinase-like enzyme [Alphaproteobacteria bacterium]|jgi:thiamine kinase-like enzyme
MLQKYELANIHSPDFEITRIVCGAINRNFKVSDGSKTLLLKAFSNNTTLPINRRQVFSMQEELAILGFAPVPLFLSDDFKIYCEQWIDIGQGVEIAEKDYAKTKQGVAKIIDTLAEALFNVHSSYVSAPIIPLVEHWEIYWQKIKHPKQQLREKYKLVKLQWQQYFDQYKDQFVLCHNDLHIDHISFSNGPIFDWEYAGLGSRYFDIASCCAINNLNQADILNLCCCYAHLANKDVQEVIDNVQETSAMVAFTYELWSESVGKTDNPE